MANRFRAERLAACRRLLLAAAVPGTPTATGTGELPVVEPARERYCPACGGRRLERTALPVPVNKS